MVAHRPSALAGIDFVLALDRGRMQAFGRKEEVYAELFPGREEALRNVERGRTASHGSLRAATLVPG
jgi:ATP-binding cassette subfamily C protein